MHKCITAYSCIHSIYDFVLKVASELWSKSTVAVLMTQSVMLQLLCIPEWIHIWDCIPSVRAVYADFLKMMGWNFAAQLQMTMARGLLTSSCSWTEKKD